MNKGINSAELETNWPIPNSWRWAEVGEVGHVALGRQRSPANHDGPFMRPYLRAANITWAGLDLSDVKEMNFDEADYKRFKLEPGDVLLNEGSGSPTEVGKPAIWTGEIEGCCFQNTLLRLQPKACNPDFAWAFFRFCALTGRFAPASQGVNIAHIGKDGLARFQIPVPPLAEQRRIVAKLDALTARTAQARADLDRVPVLAARYRQAALTQSFAAIESTATNASIDKFCLNIFDGPFGSNLKTDDYTDDGTQVVRLENIGHLSFAEHKKTFISEDKYNSLKRHTLEPGDVLFSSFVDEQIRVCVLPKLERPAINKADCFCIRVDRKLVDPKFVAYRLACVSTYETFKAMVHGATRPRINLTQLKSFNIRLPDLTTQRAVVQRIDGALFEIGRLATEAAAARRLLDRLDQAILAKAFRGELVPQDPADEPASALLERIKAERAGAPAARRGRKLKVK